MKELGTRAVTGFFFVLVVVGCVLYSKFSMGFLFLTIVLAGTQEYYKLAEKRGMEPMNWAGMGFAALLFFTSFLYAQGVHRYGLIWINLVIPSFFLVRFVFDHRENALVDLAETILGIVYVAIPISLINFLPFLLGADALADFKWVVLGMFVLIWANDTFAYLTGRLLGRNKLYESVSPGKTWEGFFGGLIFAMVVAWLYSKFFTEIETVHWIAMGAIMSIFGTIGDLVESKMKRLAGVKDSGKLMPGHGGILDRFDAFLFSIPFVFIYWLFI